MVDVSNIRPIAILAGYLATAVLLTSWCIAIIRVRLGVATGLSPIGEARRRSAMTVFSLLAVVSFATTWYHMFRFFEWSYIQWAVSSGFEQVSADPNGLHLGQWLRETQLFRQAWASTLETPPRAWWSMQIFGFCANWSVLLAAQAKKRSIPHMWVFMLLGQVVAISFAANLSFLAFTVYDVAGPSKKTPPKHIVATPSSSPFWWPVILGFNISIAVSIPNLFDNPRFMQILMLPHILAFAPLLLNRLLPVQVPAHLLNQPSMFYKIGTMAVVLILATNEVKSAGGDFDLILSTFHEHPAVSSVGWDVICCWVSFGAWHIFGQK
ncbi:hypothetical protein G7Z17_g3621 [Cylindrodendrum hubeiense]|uniref:Alpha-mannosyltransferase alg11p n=1 Tax=Cylindrodendrum hubeiense TaxID=595255 RepID=A0A9P5HAG9_9HYPO|nr:hypothetical protein G7Z17_g3621 [Cylindrodendrum hubeiense]